ncbi:hypothetical protein C3L33_13973, partial [Rhododendron williamsianum]
MAIGYSRNGYSKDALSLYVDMLRFLRPGVHAQIVKSEEGPDQFVYNGLLKLYSECGYFEDVVRVFDEMPQRDIVSWNLLISGFAGRGQLFEAFDALRRMQVEGVGFDGFTLTAALPVCARINALSVVDYARRIFDGMGRRRDLRSWNTMLNGLQPHGAHNRGRDIVSQNATEFGISPSVEHYACLVDVLGRAGRLKEALGVVKNMHEKPSGRIWGLLLNSCHIYGDLHLAETISKVLFEIEPKYVENYVVLLNIYENADYGRVLRWFHTFVAGGDLELGSSEEYQKLWSEFKEAMRVVGYYNGPDYGVVLRDVNEEIRRRGFVDIVSDLRHVWTHSHRIWNTT